MTVTAKNILPPGRRLYYGSLTFFFCMALLFFSGEVSRAKADTPAVNSVIPVIAYHEVLPVVDAQDSQDSCVMSLKEFTAQMEYLHENGYYTASMDELADFVKGKRDLPPKTVVITFDDGYESNYLYCYPYLQKYNFKATIFMMGKIPPNARRHLTGFQMLNMTRSGLVQIECHTYDCHRAIDGKPLLTVLTEEEIKNDFYKFNYLCSLIGIQRPTVIAYPYGAASPAALKAASVAGYGMGFTINSGYIKKGDPLMLLNRFLIGPDMSMDTFSSIVSGVFKK